MSAVKVERRHRDRASVLAALYELTDDGRRILRTRDEIVDDIASALATAEQRTRERCAAHVDALAALIDREGDDANAHRKAPDCEAPQYLEGVADKSELDAQKLRALAERMRGGGGG